MNFAGMTHRAMPFWGDVCRQEIEYVRNFVFDDIDTLNACPFMPYHDPDRPFVKEWFAASEGADRVWFCKTLSEENQDLLEMNGGACIMYTHYGAANFMENGDLHPRFKALMRRLSRKNGFFAPVSTILDHLKAVRGEHVITLHERASLERRWLLQKVLRGTM